MLARLERGSRWMAGRGFERDSTDILNLILIWPRDIEI